MRLRRTERLLVIFNIPNLPLHSNLKSVYKSNIISGNEFKYDIRSYEKAKILLTGFIFPFRTQIEGSSESIIDDNNALEITPAIYCRVFTQDTGQSAYLRLTNFIFYDFDIYPDVANTLFRIIIDDYYPKQVQNSTGELLYTLPAIQLIVKYL